METAAEVFGSAVTNSEATPVVNRYFLYRDTAGQGFAGFTSHYKFTRNIHGD
jgi:hypothetical protein